MVFWNNFEKSDHLLFACNDWQVLAFGNVKLHQRLLAESFNFWHTIQMIHELRDVDLAQFGRLLFLTRGRILNFWFYHLRALQINLFTGRVRLGLVHVVIFVDVCRWWRRIKDRAEPITAVHSSNAFIHWCSHVAWILNCFFSYKRRLIFLKWRWLILAILKDDFFIHLWAQNLFSFCVHCLKIDIAVRGGPFRVDDCSFFYHENAIAIVSLGATLCDWLCNPL